MNVSLESINRDLTTYKARLLGRETELAPAAHAQACSTRMSLQAGAAQQRVQVRWEMSLSAISHASSFATMCRGCCPSSKWTDGVVHAARCGSRRSKRLLSRQQRLCSQLDADGQCTMQGVLSKLNAAKELMKEFIEREKRKQKEREAAKSEATKAAESKKELEEKAADKESKPATDVLKA